MVILLTLAFLPGVAMLFFFYLRDKYKKEPFGPILLAFLLGAIVTFPASATSSLLQRLTGWFTPPTTILKIFLGAFLIAGLVEESWKFFVVRFYCYHRPEFDEPYDGILYSTAVALGFATIENILYIFHSSPIGALRIGIMRALLAVPSHAFYGVLMGYFLGEAKFARTETEANLLGILGLLLAIVAHGLYDFVVIALTLRPLLVGSLMVFSLLVWVVFFEVTRRQAEKSAHQSPKLAALKKGSSENSLR